MGDPVKEIVQQWALEVIPKQVELCKVNSVNKNNDTIDVSPVNGNADILNVRLRAIINNDTKGLTIYPEKDSMVLIGLIGNNKNSAYMVAAEKIESVRLVLDSNEMTLDKDTAKVKWKKVEFNGGNNKGFVKITKLIEKLNKIESLLTQLITWINGHTHPVSGTSASAPTVPFTGSITNTQLSDLENDKITH